ncbi:hypothetical protein FB567DRAFT_524127 [Paraphoma chrysanthemicola]|uniref:Uncharacterized protein n=1 Tax=Paraphoma chrysanthemicola TaxID=798071 RepID=A0A8K0VZF8_9PLEO|nr:hypothetical protein FB567DRAFT_524127 [Paraphoma chrysanthemicola]
MASPYAVDSKAPYGSIGWKFVGDQAVHLDANKEENSTTRLRWLSKPIQVLLIAILLSIFVIEMYWGDFHAALMKVSQPLQGVTDLVELQKQRVQYEGCSPIAASLSRHFGFNVSQHDSPAGEWHFIDSTRAESRGRVRGEVNLRRGHPLQDSDIEVRVIVNSTEEGGLQNFILNTTESTLSLDYLPSGGKDLCTDIQVMIYLRPEVEFRQNSLELRSEILHMWVHGSLAWKIDNLILHTSYGDSTFEGTRLPEPLITHNISVSSVAGTIFGWYPADGNLDIRNDKNMIGFFLVARYDRPFSPESISISSKSGTIDIRSIFEYWGSRPMAHTTNIHSESGNIWLGIPHGSITNVSSQSGNIAAYLKPWGASSPDDISEFYTSTQIGNTRIYLTDMDLDTPKKYFNPLLNTTSKHTARTGRMEICYPYSWYGEAEARIDSGSLMFDSSSLEEIERGDGWVKARRGNKGESRLEAYVESGEMEVLLGLC